MRPGTRQAVHGIEGILRSLAGTEHGDAPDQRRHVLTKALKVKLPGIGANPGSPTKCALSNLLPERPTKCALSNPLPERVPSRRWGRVARTKKEMAEERRLKHVLKQQRRRELLERRALQQAIEDKQARIDRRNRQRAWLRLVLGTSTMVRVPHAILARNAAGVAARAAEQGRQHSAIRVQTVVRAFKAAKLVMFRRRVQRVRWRVVLAVRAWRRVKQADLLLLFLRNHQGRVCRLQQLCYSVRNKFMWNVFTQHHFAKGWVDCRAARLKALGLLWDRDWAAEARRQRQLSKRATTRAKRHMTEDEEDQEKAWHHTHRSVRKLLKRGLTRTQWEELEARSTGSKSACGCPDTLKWGILRHHLAVCRNEHIARSSPLFDEMKAKELAVRNGAAHVCVEDMRRMLSRKHEGQRASSSATGDISVLAEWPMMMLYTRSKSLIRGLVISAMRTIEGVRHEPGRRRSVFQQVKALEVLHLDKAQGVRSYAETGGTRMLGTQPSAGTTLPPPKPSPATEDTRTRRASVTRQAFVRRASGIVAGDAASRSNSATLPATVAKTMVSRMIDAQLAPQNGTPAASKEHRKMLKQVSSVFARAETAAVEASARDAAELAREQKAPRVAGGSSGGEGSGVSAKDRAKSRKPRVTMFALPPEAEKEVVATAAASAATVVVPSQILGAGSPKMGLTREQRRTKRQTTTVATGMAEAARVKAVIAHEAKIEREREKYSRRMTAKGAIGGIGAHVKRKKTIKAMAAAAAGARATLVNDVLADRA